MLVVVLNAWVTETKETPCRVEALDDLGEVGQRARQAVDLVDHHRVDEAALHIGQQSLEPWTVHRAAREPAIVVGRGEC